MAKRILVVDDQVEMLRMIGMNLQNKGYVIDVAQDAPAALEKINRAFPDLLILDIMLPGISGTDLLKQIRSDPRGVHLPVIILSALTEVDDKIAGLQAGADEYLTKPIDVRELTARVAALLERSDRLRQGGDGARAQVIAFLPAIGGIGTTSLTLNTAVALTRTKSSVVAVALHPSILSFRTFLGYPESAVSTEVFDLAPGEVTADLLRRALVRHPTGIRVLAAPADIERPRTVSPELAANLLERLSLEAGFILVDLRPTVNDVARVILERSSQVLVVAEPTPACLDAARTAVAFARRWAVMASRLACVLVNRSAIAASATAADVERALGIPVVASVPQAADALAAAHKRGQLILLHQPEHGMAQTVARLAGALAESRA
jgi:DNA-binding response OmpR family regulator